MDGKVWKSEDAENGYTRSGVRCGMSGVVLLATLRKNKWNAAWTKGGALVG